ncbi:hypothetical protein BRC81_00200 [Halobacteriales archaeon QS_1_68_20]|nr:MAG: hypothetical protein BRC81_00200 [Halobacteriales archaeon QS_1_68_20]
MDGDVLIDNTPTRIKDSGKLVEQGRDAEVNLRSDRKLFVHNPGYTEAKVRVDAQNFEINLFPRRTIERPGDRATREEAVDHYRGQVTGVSSGGGSNFVLDEQNIDGPVSVEIMTVAETSGNHSGDHHHNLQLSDENGNTFFNVAMNQIELPLVLDPAIRVPDGGTVSVVATNQTASAADYEANVVYRGV